MAKGAQKINSGAQQQQQAKGKLHHLKKSGNVGEPDSLPPPARHSAKQEKTSISVSVKGELPSIPAKFTVVPKLEHPETDGETDETGKQKQHHTTRDSLNNDANPHDKHGERNIGRGRFIFKNLWDLCCNETESEVNELDLILKKMGLPSVNYSKTKAYELTDYDFAPDIHTCKSKDFLDFYVFPYLLPAIQALIQFARVNRVFQCRFCTFNALDYIVEYLYNNNPRYPQRLDNPVPIFEIPFAKSWLEKHPRKPPPKWMLMTSEEAAIIIQRVIRGYMVRSRPEVQEMRQFWREFRMDMEEEKTQFQYGKSFSKHIGVSAIFSPYYEEYRGEFDEACGSCLQLTDGSSSSHIVSNHSDHCVYCQAFRKFLDSQPEDTLRSYQKPSSIEHLSTSTPGDQPARLSINHNNEETGTTVDSTTEGLTADTTGENEDASGKSTKKESKPPSSTAQLQSQEVYVSSSRVQGKPNKVPGHATHQKSFTASPNAHKNSKPEKERKSKKHAND